MAKFTTAGEGDRWAEARKQTLEEMEFKVAPDYESEVGKKYWARVSEVATKLEKTGWRPKDLPDTTATNHIEEAMVHFEKAMRFDRKNALYRLGYASLLELAHAWVKRHPDVVVSPFLKHLDAAAIRSEYRKAWETELPADLKDKGRGMFGLIDMVSYEAGTAYVRLAEMDEKTLSAEEAKGLVKVRASLVDLAKDRSSAVTPIIFSFRPASSIVDLLAEGRDVDFPLRGWGPAERWPWLKPDTALLVWNPSRSGRIVSGAQLFGSYTWEIFWKSGYEALAVLDVDGDGELTGSELDGLAAWQDANGNGISDPSEVRSLTEVGVSSIATFASKTEGPHPMNPSGITFSDGRKLPTWDWVVSPVPRDHSAKQRARFMSDIP